MRTLHPVCTIRSFTPENVQDYKAMRLEALQSDPDMFGSTYQREAAFTNAQWLDRVINPYAACLGLYCNDELIGITGIIIDKSRPGSAQLVQSYIRKSHRGKGLSRMLYEVRLEWARQHKVERLEVCHRASNMASKAAHQHFGFTYTHSESRKWHDGATEDILYYERIV